MAVKSKKKVVRKKSSASNKKRSRPANRKKSAKKTSRRAAKKTSRKKVRPGVKKKARSKKAASTKNRIKSGAKSKPVPARTKSKAKSRKKKGSLLSRTGLDGIKNKARQMDATIRSQLQKIDQDIAKQIKLVKGVVRKLEDSRYASTEINVEQSYNSGGGSQRVSSTTRHHQIQKLYYRDTKARLDRSCTIHDTNIDALRGHQIMLFFSRHSGKLIRLLNQKTRSWWTFEILLPFQPISLSVLSRSKSDWTKIQITAMFIAVLVVLIPCVDLIYCVYALFYSLAAGVGFISASVLGLLNKVRIMRYDIFQKDWAGVLMLLLSAFLVGIPWVFVNGPLAKLAGSPFLTFILFKIPGLILVFGSILRPAWLKKQIIIELDRMCGVKI